MQDDNLRVIYEQYCLHARHQEMQRLWFINIYAIIVAGVFAYLGTVEAHDAINISLYVFLLILSLFGYLMTHSWNIAFVKYSRLAEAIAICEWSLPEEYQRFTKYRKRIRAARTFMGFYSLMIGIFTALTYREIFNITSYTKIVLAVILVLAAFYLFYQFYLESRTITSIINQFNKMIGKCRQK